jgi:hypothetical protein
MSDKTGCSLMPFRRNESNHCLKSKTKKNQKLRFHFCMLLLLFLRTVFVSFLCSNCNAIFELDTREVTSDGGGGGSIRKRASRDRYKNFQAEIYAQVCVMASWRQDQDLKKSSCLERSVTRLGEISAIFFGGGRILLGAIWKNRPKFSLISSRFGLPFCLWIP